MERGLFGQPAANAVIEEIERIGASRVFLLVGGTFNRETDEVDKIKLPTLQPPDPSQNR